MPATNLSTMQYTAPNPAEHKQTLNSNHTAEVSAQLFTDYGSKCPKVDFFVIAGFWGGFFVVGSVLFSFLFI